jgi:hypothetical protein
MSKKNVGPKKFEISFLTNKILMGLFLALNLSACVTGYQNPNLPDLVPSSQYFSEVEHNTVTKKVYDGFYQTMEVQATLLNSKVARTQLDHKARIYQWTQEQYNTNKSELESGMVKQTKIFLSFFVPERKHDDLHKPKTLWKIFLDAGGRRYEGKAEKLKTILADVQSLYPSHTRFNTPYVLNFPVPISQVENVESHLTLTGPVGSTTIDFPPVQ